jgi:sugar/nucleoside kinase (ribokinase family)
VQHDVVGLGNAIMDALVRIEDDSILTELGLVRGQMHPVDDARWREVFRRVEPLGAETASGGSCANTISTMALLGARVLYCGQIGADPFGEAYARSMHATCGTHALVRSDVHATGKCLSLISTRDGERTMLTDLGAAVHLEDFGGFGGEIARARLLHLTGYLFLDGPIRSVAHEAVRAARDAGVPISLDVADPFVARTKTEDMRRLLKEVVTVGFLNREEAEAVTGRPAHEAVEEIGDWCRVAVVKLGAEGSLVRAGGRTHAIPVVRVPVADTTGAGDAYAGGYLYGWLHGWDPDRCGQLAARVAALTVRQVGAVCRDRAAITDALRAVRGDHATPA